MHKNSVYVVKAARNNLLNGLIPLLQTVDPPSRDPPLAQNDPPSEKPLTDDQMTPLQHFSGLYVTPPSQLLRQNSLRFRGQSSIS
jgi:hypothetical protein